MQILHNAKIYTPFTSDKSALVIDHGFFVALGTDAEILDQYPNPETNLDLQGRILLPGLTDAHVHLRHLAESMATINCETATCSECLRRVKIGADKLSSDAWVLGHGWNQNEWEEGFGTANQLENVTGGRPAYLTAKSLHAAWANKSALKMAGIDAQTPDPPGGTIQRDESGVPTGILFEAGAMSLVESIIPKPSQAALQKELKTLFPKLWELGLVGVHDFDGFDCWLALQALYQSRQLGLRVRKNIPFDHLENFIQAGLRTDFGNDWLQVGSLKLFADGALGPQTAAMLEPYEGGSEMGNLLLSSHEITEIGKTAADHGIALAVHAIGDRANREVLNAFEALRKYEKKKGLFPFNHRIEHVQILHPADIHRLCALKVIASVQPVHAPSDMEIADKTLGSRVKGAYAYRSLIAAGTVLVFGSDAPVEPVNPFQGIHAAVTRTRLDGSPGINGWQPQECLTLTQALQGYTHIPALISNHGSRLGKIAPGFKADFLILDQDPFTVDPKMLGKLKPSATFIEGNCVYHDPNLDLPLGNG